MTFTDGKPENLEAILGEWSNINSTLDPEEVYARACRAAVSLLGVDHSSFVRFDEHLRLGRVMAHFPESTETNRAADMDIPLAGVPEEELLIHGDVPLQFSDVQSQLSPGVFRDNLAKLGVRSVLIVKVAWKGRALGSFGLDSIKTMRSFSDAEVKLCELLATMIANALQNAQAFRAETYRTELLRRLEEYRIQLKPASNELEFRQNLVNVARDLCGWTAGFLYVFAEDAKELRLVAKTGGTSLLSLKFVYICGPCG